MRRTDYRMSAKGLTETPHEQPQSSAQNHAAPDLFLPGGALRKSSRKLSKIFVAEMTSFARFRHSQTGQDGPRQRATP
jgi:hypothetical protein